ncbi:uncharacterized protein [Engystomops pustulosus]|uniref:uncharacterized protein n=1 Tax=Engystomops pustulosus TaxID=76066 RepID=UPI003AFB4582
MVSIQESKDKENKGSSGKKCSSKRKPPTCRTCGWSLPHEAGRKLSKDCLIEESPDPTSKAWCRKVMDWVEDYVQSKDPKDDLLGDTERTTHQTMSFHYGISNKIFSVESDCEVRIQLSQEEISQLSFNFNLLGFIVSILAHEEYVEHLRSFLQEVKDVDVLQKICRPAGDFFCSSDSNKRRRHLEDLEEVLENKIKVACSKLGEATGSWVCGALIALAAAELALTHGRAQDFDDRVENIQSCPEPPNMEKHQKLEKTVRDFDAKTELKAGIRWTKETYSLYRNKSLNGWVMTIDCDVFY